MSSENTDFINLHDAVELHEEEEEEDYKEEEKEEEHEWSGELHSEIEVEVEEEELEPCEETVNAETIRELDGKLKENLTALTSREFTLRVRGAKGFRDMLKGESGAQVLQQYVKASPGCTELLEAWKLGIQGKSSVSIFWLIAEILKHPGGKDLRDDCRSDEQRSKIVMYVSLRLDKFARTVVRTKINDVYVEINSHERKRQNAALLLMAAIVRRGRTIASEVAASFDFKNKVFSKLAELPKAKRKAGEDDKKPKSSTRRGFIEFAMAFLEVSNPSLLRYVLQKRPLYGGLLRGLAKDDEETILYVLGIIQEKVLSSSSMVPSGLRSAVFGDATLEQLSVISADCSLGRAAEIAHETLLMLCTDSCHGLLPKFSQSISKGNENLHRGNPARLLRLMLKLRSTDVDNHRNLLLAIVSNWPSLVSAYFDAFPYSLEPRASSAWFAAVSLVSDLIDAAKVSPLFSSLATEKGSPLSLEHPTLRSRLKCILPRSFSRAVINRGLLHTNIFVKHGSLRVLKEALSSLECLLNTIHATTENASKKGLSTEMQKESLSKCISESHLLEVKGLSGISVLRALSSSAQSEENSLSCTDTFIELSSQKWFLLKREVQDEIRGLLPDPQVLLSLLSSTNSELTDSAGRNNKRKFPSTNSKEVETKAKFKKIKSDSIDSGVEIVVSGIKAVDRKDILEGYVAFYPDQESHALDNTDEDLVTVAQIWGLQGAVSYRDDCKDDGSMLNTKVLDVLGLYQRTLPIAMIECYFDAFKLLPENPLRLYTSQQRSILSLLVESTGGINLPASGFEGSGRVTGQLYKYLRPLLKLMLYSPAKDVRRYAHLLAYRAMLSTCAFERNKGEIELWFSFLYVQNSAEVVVKEEEMHLQNTSSSDMSGGLASTVMEFLCDAVSTVGKNLFKYLDELHCLLSKLSSRGDLAPPHFSPLVICVLQKCLRVVESSSKSLKLAQRTMISIYVASVMNFLLQSQFNSRALASIIVTMLLRKFRQVCQSDQTSEGFLCEWSPLRSLLLFAQSILSKEQAGSSLELIDNQLLSKGNPSMPRSLPQVLSIVENIDCERTFGAAAAFASSIVSAMPEEIVENFPTLITICYKVFGKDYSVLLTLLCVHRELFGRVAEAWAAVFSFGLELAGNLYLRNRDKTNLQMHKDDRQDSCVDYGFNFSTMRCGTTEKQTHSVSMGDACSNEEFAVGFASFIQSIPFFTLFMLSANSYQSRILGCTSMKGILEAKLSEVSCDYINTLQLILHWILQIEFSWCEGADLKEQLETCFSLLRNLLVHAIEVSQSDHCIHRLDVGLDMTSIEELIQTVLVHPAINMFMHKWMRSSVSKNVQDLEDCDTKSMNLHCNEWKRKADTTNLEIFLHLCQEKVHAIDTSIIHILMTLMELAASQCKIKQSRALNQWDSFCKAIVLSSKPLILRSFAVFKKEIAKRMKADSYEISPLSSFYVLSVLCPFVSPFDILELVHWLFSHDIYEHKETAASISGSNISYLDVGLYFGTVAFEMFHTYLTQAKGDASIHWFFWDLEGQKFDVNLVREVYVKMVEVAIKQNSKTAELCLLRTMKALHVQTGANIPPRLLPIGILLSHLTLITPTKLVKHCIYNTNQVKAETLLLLTQISNLHLTVSGELIGANINIDLPAIHLIHLNGDLIIDEKFLEGNTDIKLSKNELLVLLPVTLRYISSNLRIAGASFLQSLKRITAYYFNNLWKGFMKWDEYTRSKEFDILVYDEGKYMITEDFVCYFQGTLLGQAVRMLKTFPNLEKLRKKRRKLFTCILPKIGCPLDYFNNDISGFSFRELLNAVNMVIAKVSLARWLLFPKSACLNLHLERNSDEQPQNGVSKCSPGKITDSDFHEWRMEPAEYARFINSLICTLDAIFQHFSIQSQTFGDKESRKRANLLNFMERTLLNHLVDLSKEIGIQSIKIQYLPSLKAFTKSTFLHRFENCMALKTLRCLLLLLSQKDHASDIVVQFAEEALGFLMAHSQFISTILSTSFISLQSLGQSDKGTMFKSLTGILNLLPLPSLDQHGDLNYENITVSPCVHSRETVEITSNKEEDLYFLEQRKVEVVKLLRMLYLLRVQHGCLSGSRETCINAKELFSLLLAGYGATMNACDLEIFSLMHEIECFSGKSFSGLFEMNYLWGEAALKRRRQQHDERLLSEYSSVDQETTEERQKREFRDNLLIDPNVCGDTILHFPFNRNAWEGPIELAKFAEESFKEINLETKARSALNSSCINCYDPAFMLEFSMHALSVRYIDSMEFSRLGLLGLAFASLSSPNESIRKLAYGVLGRYTQNLENGRNFKGRAEIQLLLMHVKNAIVEPWQKIPSVLALFAAEASCILMDPTNNHYATITHFLTWVPSMVLESIPLFRSMFGSDKVHYQNDRIWILRLVAAGLNLTEDFQIYRRKFVLELLMSFYGSPLADFKTKLLVLQVLKKAVKSRTLAQYLVERAGLLLWLSSAVLNYDESKSSRSETCFVSIVLEMIVDLLSWRSIRQRLLTNGFEQLSQTASCLHRFLVYNSSSSGRQATIIKSVLQILASTISLSQQRKLYQTHFCLCFEGLFQVIQLIELRDPDMTSSDIVELGLRIILASFPPAVNAVKDKLKLLKLGLWAISSALQTRSLSSTEEEVYPEKQWKSFKVQQYEEALLDKLLRWLVASVILGKIYRTTNQGQALYPVEKHNRETLLSLLNYLKPPSCLSEMEHNPEVDKSLAQLILYLYQLVGVRCRVFSSVVTAVSLLLLSEDANFIDGTSWHTNLSSLLALLLSEVSCPAEVNPSWRWSFYSPWEDLSSKISDVQRLFEYEVCQLLLRSFQNFLSGTTPSFHFIISRQKLGLPDTLSARSNELCDKLDTLKAEMCQLLSNGLSNQDL